MNGPIKGAPDKTPAAAERGSRGPPDKALVGLRQ